MNEDPPPVVADAIAKSFGSRRALQDLSLRVARREIVGFVGPNGAGKSTLLRILTGLVPADAGRVAVFGIDPGRDEIAVRRRVSYLPGETNVYSQMTGQEYLDFATGFHRGTLPVPAAVQEAFEVPLSARVRTYSAGMKQKLALRAALTCDVDLFVLDEPDRALDASVRLALRRWIEHLRSELGRAVLLSSHHLAEVEALADRVAFVFNGRNVADEAVRAARETLRHEVRLRLEPGTDLPDGAERLADPPDGTVRVRVPDDPLRWLARLSSDRVLTAEVGPTRLEDVYAVLAESGATGNDVDPSATEALR